MLALYLRCIIWHKGNVDSLVAEGSGGGMGVLVGYYLPPVVITPVKDWVIPGPSSAWGPGGLTLYLRPFNMQVRGTSINVWLDVLFTQAWLDILNHNLVLSVICRVFDIKYLVGCIGNTAWVGVDLQSDLQSAAALLIFVS